MNAMKRARFVLPVAGFGFRTFVIAGLGLWLVATLAFYIAAAVTSTSDSVWLVAGTRAFSQISSGLLALLVIWGLWSGAARLIRAIVPGLLATSTVEVTADAGPEAEEVPEIRQTLRGLAQALVALETDSSRASLLLLDADQFASNLVALVKAIALRAEAMRGEVTGLQAALDAITARDPVRIAAAAGRVADPHIRELLLCNVGTADYWAGVARVVAGQLGTLEQWSSGYDRFAGNMLAEIGSAKTRLAAMTASLDLVGTARPLLQIQNRLDEAQICLQPQRRPELGAALKALPAINAGLR